MLKFCRSRFLVSLVLLVSAACTQSRVSVYQDALEPLVGNAKRDAVDKLLGPPTTCTRMDATREVCEYRTAYGRNEPIPDVHRKGAGFANPDLRPYDYFDVLQLDYDGFGVLRDWQAVVIKP